MLFAALGLEECEAHDLLDRLGEPPQFLKRRGDPDDVPRHTDRHDTSIPYLGYTWQVLVRERGLCASGRRFIARAYPPRRRPARVTTRLPGGHCAHNEIGLASALRGELLDERFQRSHVLRQERVAHPLDGRHLAVGMQALGQAQQLLDEGLRLRLVISDDEHPQACRPVNVSLASSALASTDSVRAVGFATPCSMRLTTLWCRPDAAATCC